MSQIRFLVISDTHGKWPYSPTNPAPKADVLLHCGDLTQVGGLPSFKRAIEDVKTVDAELKLVIAGNHDLELDERWVRDDMENEEDVKEHFECVTYMKGLKSERIHYLEEGTYTFELSEGRKFSIYASPYTPEFNGYAFAYAQDEDWFNHGANPVPENVDIVMTHGPPSFLDNPVYDLDANHNKAHCGCIKLSTAIKRASPRIHCFGHIHEGRGAVRVEWKSESSHTQPTSAVMEVLPDNGTILNSRKKSEGMETLLVNAAMNDDVGGWLIDYEM